MLAHVLKSALLLSYTLSLHLTFSSYFLLPHFHPSSPAPAPQYIHLLPAHLPPSIFSCISSLSLSLSSHSLHTSSYCFHLFVYTIHPFHSSFQSIPVECPSAVFFFFFSFFPALPSYLHPPPSPHFTCSHRGTAVGDRPAEITVLLLESIQPGTSAYHLVPSAVFVCLCTCVSVCHCGCIYFSSLPQAEMADNQRHICLAISGEGQDLIRVYPFLILSIHPSLSVCHPLDSLCNLRKRERNKSDVGIMEFKKWFKHKK